MKFSEKYQGERESFSNLDARPFGRPISQQELEKQHSDRVFSCLQVSPLSYHTLEKSTNNMEHPTVCRDSYRDSWLWKYISSSPNIVKYFSCLIYLAGNKLSLVSSLLLACNLQQTTSTQIDQFLPNCQQTTNNSMKRWEKIASAKKNCNILLNLGFFTFRPLANCKNVLKIVCDIYAPRPFNKWFYGLACA